MLVSNRIVSTKSPGIVTGASYFNDELRKQKLEQGPLSFHVLKLIRLAEKSAVVARVVAT